jgi:PmbA protein
MSNNENRLVGFAHKTVDYAIKGGAEQAEAYSSAIQILTVNVENGELKLYGSDYHEGLGVRVLKNKKLGFYYTTSFDEKSLASSAKNALKFAALKSPDPEFKEFPKPKLPTKVSGVLDKSIVNIDSATAAGYMSRLIEAAKLRDNRIIPTFGVFESSYKTFSVVNSNGVEVSHSGTTASIGLRTLIDSKDGASNGLNYQVARNLNELDPEWIGRRSAELAISSMKPRRIKSIKTTVILDPEAVSALFGEVLMPALYANRIQDKSSYFVDKVSSKVGSENVTIIDDGTFAGGYRTASVDEEGVPTKKKTLINKGILGGFLYDSYTAGKDGKQSTGNAVRFEGFGPDRDGRGREYSMVPKIGGMNFIMSKGSAKRDSLIEETEDGVLVTFAVGGGSPTSGDFSADTRNAYRIENGEVTYPIRQAIFAGNMLELLSNIDAVSGDPRWCGGLKPGQVLSPTVRVKDGSIIGDIT